MSQNDKMLKTNSKISKSNIEKESNMHRIKYNINNRK